VSQVFVGRDALLDELLDRLRQPSRPVALEGPPGIGKTELALQLVTRLESEGFRIFWLDAEAPDLTPIWGGTIAAQLGFEDQKLAQRAQRVLEAISSWNGPVLVVLDNATQWSTSAPWPRPRGSHIRWLVTTRTHHLGNRELRSFGLDFLSERAASELVTTIHPACGRQPGFGELIGHLDGYPIALELAASFLDRFPDWTPRAYLDALRTSEGRELESRAEHMTLYGATLERAFELLWNRLPPAVHDGWRVAACFADAAVGVELSQAAGLDERAREQLRRFHLISTGAGGIWSMHRLTRAFGRRAGDPTGQRTAQTAFLHGCVERARLLDAYNTIEVYVPARPHLDAALALAGQVVGEHSAVLTALRHRTGAARYHLGENDAARGLLQEAAEDYRAAMERTSAAEAPLKFAELSHALGDVLMVHAGQEPEGTRLAQANQAYRAALAARPRDQVPLLWAETMERLGSNLWERSTRRAELAPLEEAIQIFGAALEELSPDSAPGLWAQTRSSLGNAHALMGSRHSGTEHFRLAVSHCDAALRVQTREESPVRWALTQTHLAFSLLEWAKREPGTTRLQEAVERLRTVLEVFTRDRDPLSWAMFQRNLSIALLRLGERAASPLHVHESAALCREILEAQSLERLLPMQWASTQYALGNVYFVLAEMEGESKHCERATHAFRAALEIYTRERSPIDFGGLQNNLGAALFRLSGFEPGTKHLEEAADAYHAALGQFRREHTPAHWAGIQQNMGEVMTELAIREGRADRIHEAIRCFRAALEEYRLEESAQRWADTFQHIANALLKLSTLEPGGEARSEALAMLLEARERWKLVRDDAFPTALEELILQAGSTRAT